MCNNLPPLDQDWAFKLRDRYAEEIAHAMRAALERDLNYIFRYGIDYHQRALLEAQADAHETSFNTPTQEALDWTNWERSRREMLQLQEARHQPGYGSIGQQRMGGQLFGGLYNPYYTWKLNL